ncbi:decarbamoylnovobiocin carbamoyltransferase [bacterium BMS3Bbin11]|nr:decarbamoylnovobiocin carbamoyltransferase [bacterium BMS3Bbin11]
MIILGLNAYHGDSAAALVINGKLVAAAEEERFRRKKNWAGFPSESIAYCLREAGLSLADVDAVAINQDSKANYWKKIGYTLMKRPELKFVLDKLRNRRDREGLDVQLQKHFEDSRFAGKVYPVEHHIAHLSSTFHVSPFDEAVVVSVDGFGDFASGAWGMGKGSKINVDGKVYFPHSLGNFYQALTQYLGFPHYGDEYKVMGLAPYGKPVYLEEMRKVVKLMPDGGYRLNLEYFKHHKENVVYEWDDGAPVFGQIYSDKLVELLGPVRANEEELTQRHFDIAHSVQARYEEAFFHLLNTLYDRHGLDDLCLSGGCAMNSVANGKVYRKSPFKRVYIQSAAGDAGGAIGAALIVWYEKTEVSSFKFQVSSSKIKDENIDVGAPSPALLRKEGVDRFVMDHAFWGPSFSNEQIAEVLEKKQAEISAEGCTTELISNEDDLCRKTAEAISEGKVIGWFQGRMEWGPRALGNRSIVCDPRRADMKDILNLKIKRRESFRPFAPSILRGSVSDWFEEDDDVPFMMKVFQIREGKRAEIPAVTHVDGSGRLQTVYKETNARYFNLIDKFNDLTGVPIVLNTSFNENEPVVCKPEEALACFLRTKMDVLVMGDWLVWRA